MKWPDITCLCPTGGRFERLRESLAFFLAQEYPGRARLLIFSESRGESYLTADVPGVRACNVGAFETLGHKRQALLENADTPLVAHWDDDDVYLPDHLTRSVRHLLAQGVDAVKARGAYYLTGPRGKLDNRGVHHNVFEGTMVFRREAALAVGGYPPIHSGQALALWRAFGTRRSRLPEPPTYAYRWNDGLGHISALAAGKKRLTVRELYDRRNTDHGSGWLTPAPIGEYYRAVGLDTDVQ